MDSQPTDQAVADRREKLVAAAYVCAAGSSLLTTIFMFNAFYEYRQPSPASMAAMGRALAWLRAIHLTAIAGVISSAVGRSRRGVIVNLGVLVGFWIAGAFSPI